MKSVIALIIFLSCFSLYPQSKDDFGFAEKSIPELSQYEYYRGVWKTEMELKQDDGTFKKLDADQ